MPSSSQPPVTNEEKQSALEDVLSSAAFARSEQLRAFLRFVCEMEIAGQVDRITEYAVATRALARPVDFNPAEDSSVRNRAHALRQKLDGYYATESSSSEVRIEFGRGSYIPRFVRVTEPRKDIPPPAPERAQGRGTERIVWLGVSLAVGVLAGLLTSTVARQNSSAVPPAVREAWGPLLARDADVTVCLATAASLALLPMRVQLPGSSGEALLEAPEALRPWYLQRHHSAPGEPLFMVPNDNAPFFGEVSAALLMVKTLLRAGVDYEVLPERAVPVATLRSRNAILLGAPHYSEAVQQLLASRAAFNFHWDPKLADFLVTGRGETFLPKRDERREHRESFGLISVFPSEGDPTRRTVVLSGDPSASTIAAAEFFSSEAHLSEFRGKLAGEGISKLPPAYQIVVRTEIHANLPLRYSYAAHAILR
ncbi:MAG: hypothetical protein NTY38_07085 [Acidobacteria bacterium]|nr:hypothetical protein [Acidobacteriota bacterium]